MRKTLSNPVFLSAVALATINQILEKGFGIFIPVIHSYLDDLLCFPIVLTLGLSVYRSVYPNYCLNWFHMLSVLIIYSVYFEWILPKQSSNFTADPFDVIMYLIGLAIFSYFINQNNDLGSISRTKHIES